MELRVKEKAQCHPGGPEEVTSERDLLAKVGSATQRQKGAAQWRDKGPEGAISLKASMVG